MAERGYELHGIVSAGPGRIIQVARPTSDPRHFVEVRILWDDPDGSSGRQDAVLTFEDTAHLVEALASALRASPLAALAPVAPTGDPP
jgi:hypothetical protein